MRRARNARAGRATRRAVVATVVAVLACVTAPSAAAHLVLGNGTWSFRYFTKDDDDGAWTHCQNGTGSVDPLGIILYQYGEYSRIFSHLVDETSYDDNPIGSSQIICGTDDGAWYFTQGMYDKQGAPFTCARYHFRLWWAPHPHGDLWDKFSVISPHHENCPSHDPDDHWETASVDVMQQMCSGQYDGNCAGPGHHSAWWDAYYRDAGYWWRGFWQNGQMDRIGGLHDNQY